MSIIDDNSKESIQLLFNERMPDIQDDQMVIIPFTGGMDSYLCALLAKQKYGIDKIIFLYVPIYSKLAENDDKRQRVESDFFRGIERIGGKNHCIMYKTDISPYKDFATNVLEVVIRKFKVPKYLILFSYGKAQLQNYELLKDCGWSKGLMTRDEVLTFFQNHKTDYPELDTYINTYGGWLFFMGAPWEDIDSIFSYSTFPFYDLTSSDIAKTYDKLGYVNDLFSTISCNQSYANSDVVHHCGKCKNCNERRDSIRKAGIEDKTVYLE